MKKYIICSIFMMIFGMYMPVIYSQKVVSQNNIQQFTSEEKPWIWWFWLGNIVSEKLIDQHLESYAKAGYGGVNIIASYGVKGYEDKEIKYRSLEWYKMIRYAIDKAAELDMGVDMALSSAWPFGGPQVDKKDGAKFLKNLVSFETTSIVEKNLLDDKTDDYVIAVSAFSNKGETVDLTSYVNGTGTLKTILPEGKWRIEAVLGGYTNQQVKRSSPGGEGVVIDHFDRSSIKNYLSDFDRDMTKIKGVRGVFNDSYEVYGADYTTTFITEFEKRRGYSPKPYFSLLFKNEKNELAERFLCDYRTTIADLILDNFLKSWTEWSHSYSLKTVEQAHGSPSNILDMFAATDIPQCESFGPSCFDVENVRIDTDTKRDYFKRPDILHMKMASSAGNLMGRKLVSSETATWLTNHFRTALSQVKPEVDKLFVAGINHIHLISSTNTPLDSPYPGWVFYPAPDFGPRSALLSYMPDFNLYVARTQQVLQHSTPDNDILLYYPISDYFSEVKNDLGVLAMMDHISTKWGNEWPFAIVARKLKEEGYQFDYVSDKLLQKMTVERGMAKSEGGSCYKAIVVPACKRIPVETMQKLISLADAGVTIVFDSKMPGDVPGLNDVSGRMKTLVAQRELITSYKQVFVTTNIDSLLNTQSLLKTSFSKQGLEFIRKRYKDGKVYFIANQKSKFKEGWVELDAIYKAVVVHDLMTGTFSKAYTQNYNKTSVFLQLAPGQSVMLFADCGVKSTKKYDYFTEDTIPLQTNWTITFDEQQTGTPSAIITSKLLSWTVLGDSAHLYYNGIGHYKALFDRPLKLETSDRIRLKFSNVRDMAEVYINGCFIGKTWSVPYYVDFDAKLLKQRNNEIVVKVTNLATNKIIGMDRKGVQWQECYVADPKRPRLNTADWEIEPSGIIGPITFTGNKR